jgi:hypothetical protein
MAGKYRFSLIIVLSIAILIVHSIYLTADTPDWFADYDTGLRVDEGYKTLAPRNLVLFGQTIISEHDQYRGWFKNSFLTQSLLFISFNVFDPSLLVARATNLSYYLILIFLILWAHREHLKKISFALIILIAATEPFTYFFSRVALFEIAIALIVTAGLLSIRIDSYKGLWAFVLLTVIGAAIIKTSVLVYLFPGIIALILYNYFLRPDLKYIRIATIVVVAIVLILLALNFNLLLQRIDFRPSPAQLSKMITNPIIIYSPWVFAAALYCIADIIIRGGFRMPKDPYFIAVSAVAIGGPVILTFISYNPPRYYVALLPSYILIVAYWLTYHGKNDQTAKKSLVMELVFIALIAIASYTLIRGALMNFVVPVITSSKEFTLWMPRESARLSLFAIGGFSAVILLIVAYFKRTWVCIFTRMAVIVSLAFTIVINSWQVIEFWKSPSYASQHIRENLKSFVEPGDAIIGDWAPFFALGTDIPAIYSELRWNYGDRVLLLRPSYFLYSGTLYDRANLESYKGLDGLIIEEVGFLGVYYKREVHLFRLNYST